MLTNQTKHLDYKNNSVNSPQYIGILNTSYRNQNRLDMIKQKGVTAVQALAIISMLLTFSVSGFDSPGGTPRAIRLGLEKAGYGNRATITHIVYPDKTYRDHAGPGLDLK